MREWLSEIAKQHKKWVNMARYFGVGDYAEDIVQEMYLKLHRVYGDSDRDIRDSLVIQVIKTLCMDFHKANGKIKKVGLSYVRNHMEEAESYNEDFHELTQKIRQRLEDLHFFYERFYHHYTDVDFFMHTDSDKINPSLRDMASELDMSLRSVQNFKENMDLVIKEFHDDYKKLNK